MKITYTNPAPDEDMHPGEAVHWKDRGVRYFDYPDVWFDQLDRGHVVQRILAPLDQSPQGQATQRIAELVAGQSGRHGLRNVGLITDDLRLARVMLDRGVDFISDFRTGLFFFDLRGGHEIVMGALMTLHTGHAPPAGRLHSYIDTGLGMFRSSQSPKTEIGHDTPLPAWAKLARLDIHRRNHP